MAKGPPVKRTSYHCALVDRYKEEQRFPECVLLQISPMLQCSRCVNSQTKITVGTVFEAFVGSGSSNSKSSQNSFLGCIVEHAFVAMLI